ncbi:serine phosphatase RsbU regulator of sigma subunit [Clostridium sp. CAG:964]|nr:serine phosphatase RsbU regulator of sigma subunit [Clostridium sp. CAG:964]
MKNSLLKRIVVYICAVFLAAILVFGSLSCIDNIQRTTRLTTNIAKSASYIVSQIASDYDMESLLNNPSSKRYSYLQSSLRSICIGEGLEYIFIYIPDTENNQIKYVMVVAADEKKNREVLSDRKAGTIVEHKLFDAEVKTWNSGESTVYEYSNETYGRFASSFNCIYDKNNNPAALVCADYSLEKIYTEIISETVLKMSVVIIVLFLLFALMALFIKKKVYNPITMVFNGMKDYITDKKVGKKTFQPIDLGTNDEIQLIASFFNEMAADIDSYVDKIEALAGERAKAETELEVARRIQYGIISKEKNICMSDSFMISARMKSARQVGGDFYDSFPLKNGNVCTVIGDVSGKGVAASLFMVFVKTLIREKLTDISDIAETVKSINLDICRSNPEEMFVTAFIAIFDKASGKFCYVNAGHNKPVIIRNGKAEFLNCPPCMALGVFDDSEYKQYTADFSNGDILYLYTDGVTEAVNENKEFFGEKRLLDACTGTQHTAKGLCQSISSSLIEFINTGEQFDDITMLAVQCQDSTLKLNCRLSELEKIREYIFKTDLEDKLKRKIFLACDEVFSNIVNYSGADLISVLYNKNDDKISIIFRDNGKKFDYLKDMPKKDFDDFDNGGMGIMIVKKLCTDIVYNYINGENILELIFTL